MILRTRLKTSCLNILKVAPVFALLVLTVTGCGKDEKQAPPALPVTVAEVTTETVPIYLEYVGTTQSIQTVDINARVEGFLVKRAFRDGADVEEGALLFVIDPRPFEADLQAAQADLAENRAALAYAEEQVRRYKPIVEKEYITQDTYDGYVTRAAEAQAAVEAAQANVTQAKLNLSYCTMYAPFSGRIGRRYVDVGNLVGAAGAPTKLATMVQLDPMYVYFSVAERDIPQIFEEHSKNDLAVSIVLPDESTLPEDGRIDFINNEVDVNTGTMEMRAVVPNSSKTMLPGQFVKVKLLLKEQPDALLVPQQAVSDFQGQQFVYVVGADNKVEYRNVTTGPNYNELVVIQDGVKTGEKVITEGLQKVKPDMTVVPETASQKSQKSTPQPSPSGEKDK
ncbi:MAG: efflux RND transporter periplasmic adaptor subunit [Candidatus Dadabacteria bacterium]|nr:efflux RND transporter periplasmic adaptor subunit [Candidatus Dadabacteria bacterium]